MKTFFYGIVSVMILFFSAQVMAAEIGFRSGLISNYFGEVELFSGQKVRLKDADTPLSLFVKLDKVRVSYTQYTQHASDKYSSGGVTGVSSVIARNSFLSFDYLFDIGEDEYPPYVGVGIGLFRSNYTWDATITDGSTIITVSGSVRTSNAFDAGFIFIAGKKFPVGSGYIGAEANCISKDITPEPNAGESTGDPVNIGGTILAITAGVKF